MKRLFIISLLLVCLLTLHGCLEDLPRFEGPSTIRGAAFFEDNTPIEHATINFHLDGPGLISPVILGKEEVILDGNHEFEITLDYADLRSIFINLEYTTVNGRTRIANPSCPDETRVCRLQGGQDYDNLELRVTRILTGMSGEVIFDDGTPLDEGQLIVRQYWISTSVTQTDTFQLAGSSQFEWLVENPSVREADLLVRYENEAGQEVIVSAEDLVCDDFIYECSRFPTGAIYPDVSIVIPRE